LQNVLSKVPDVDYLPIPCMLMFLSLVIDHSDSEAFI